MTATVVAQSGASGSDLRRRGVGLQRVLRLSVSTWRHGVAWRGGLAPGVYLDRVLTGPSHRTAAQRTAPHRVHSLTAL